MEYTVKKHGIYEIREYPILDSTNEQAKRLSADSPDNIVIVANTQTKGRGRGSREWVSEDGNLFFSIVINSSKIKAPQLVSYIAALSVAEFMKARNLNAQIKWPNDVLIDCKKICGILPEKNGDKIIIGIGINTASSPQYLEEGRKTCCLKEHLSDVDNNIILSGILSNFEKNLNELSKNGFTNIRKNILTVLYKLNEQVELDYLGQRVVGKIEDISEEGNLVISTSKGSLEYKTGEIFDL